MIPRVLSILFSDENAFPLLPTPPHTFVHTFAFSQPASSTISLKHPYPLVDFRLSLCTIYAL